jgi:hypothetical protein
VKAPPQHGDVEARVSRSLRRDYISDLGADPRRASAAHDSSDCPLTAVGAPRFALAAAALEGCVLPAPGCPAREPER